MIRGTSRQQPLLPTRESAFDDAAAIVQWWLGAGRLAIGGVQGFDPSKVRTARGDRHLRELAQLKFAFVVKATQVLTERQVLLMQLRYREGLSDTTIAERLGTTRRSISRDRINGLRRVHHEAQTLGLIQRENP